MRPARCIKQAMSEPTKSRAPLSFDPIHLVVRHRRRQLGQLDGEGAPKAAALLRQRQLDELQALDPGKEAEGRLPYPQAPGHVARRVVGRHARVGGAQILDAQHVDDELGEFVALLGKGQPSGSARWPAKSAG